MKKKYIWAVLLLLAAASYLQWGRRVTVRNTMSSSWDGKRTEYMTVVANKLYIWDREAYGQELVETCIGNHFRDVRFSYDMGYPVEITMEVYANETARRLGIKCCSVRYAQREEDGYRYNVWDNPEKFTLTVD